MKTYTSGFIIRSILTIVALTLVACLFYYLGALGNIHSNPITITSPDNINTNPQPPVACTMDARMCPDGSYVGRSGPNCEFICPTK